MRGGSRDAGSRDNRDKSGDRSDRDGRRGGGPSLTDPIGKNPAGKDRPDPIISKDRPRGDVSGSSRPTDKTNDPRPRIDKNTIATRDRGDDRNGRDRDSKSRDAVGKLPEVVSKDSPRSNRGGGMRLVEAEPITKESLGRSGGGSHFSDPHVVEASHSSHHSSWHHSDSHWSGHHDDHHWNDHWDSHHHWNGSWGFSCWRPYHTGFYFGSSWCSDNFAFSISFGDHCSWGGWGWGWSSCWPHSSWYASYGWHDGCWSDCWYPYRRVYCYPRYSYPVYYYPETVVYSNYDTYDYAWLDQPSDDPYAQFATSGDSVPSSGYSSGEVASSGTSHYTVDAANQSGGWQMLADGDAREARRAFDRSLAVQPADALPRIGYAIAAGMLDRTDECVASLRQALRQDPESLNELPQNAGMDSRIRTLRDAFETRLGASPDDVDVLFAVATLRYLDGDRPMAYFAADRAIERGDSDAATRNLKDLIRRALDNAGQRAGVEQIPAPKAAPVEVPAPPAPAAPATTEPEPLF